MEFNDIINAIGSLGFPIICTIGLFRFLSKIFISKMDEIEKILYEIRVNIQDKDGDMYGQ